MKNKQILIFAFLFLTSPAFAESQTSASVDGTSWCHVNPAHYITWRQLQATEMYPYQQVVPFNEAGQIRLRELSYWSSFSSNAMKMKLLAQMRFLDAMESLVDQQVAYRSSDYTEGEARAAIARHFYQGSSVSKLAATVDRVYEFNIESKSCENSENAP